MNDKEKLHWYLCSFITKNHFASEAYGFDQKKITQVMIDEVRNYMSDCFKIKLSDVILTSISYLGYMTAEEFDPIKFGEKKE